MASVCDKSQASRKLEHFDNGTSILTDKESKSENNNSITGSSNKVELKKSITLLGIIAILVANIGGSGIFIFPTAILSVAGSPGMALIMWTFGGIIQVGLAFSVLEVALMFNKAGGPYYFIYHTFGNLAGFVFMWGFIIFIASPMWALGAYTTSLYLLSVIYSGCLPSDGVVKLVAAWIMLTLIAVNCTYMKVVTSIQKFLTLCKVLALVIIIILGFIHIPTGWVYPGAQVMRKLFFKCSRYLFSFIFCCVIKTFFSPRSTPRNDFIFYADRLIRLVVEEGLNKLPYRKCTVITPAGHPYEGLRYEKGNCGVSIVRSGEAMEQGLRDCCRSIRIGKILIRSGDDANDARVVYANLPKDINQRKVLLMYPIMSTGKIVSTAVKNLQENNVHETNIILLNLFSTPQAATQLVNEFPGMTILTTEVHPIAPTHFGQKYFGTD